VQWLVGYFDNEFLHERYTKRRQVQFSCNGATRPYFAARHRGKGNNWRSGGEGTMDRRTCNCFILCNMDRTSPPYPDTLIIPTHAKILILKIQAQTVGRKIV